MTMTQASTTPPSNATLLLDRSNLVSLTSQGPTLNDVSSQVLREALKQLYPQLDIDPDQTLIVTPRWRMEDGGWNLEGRLPSRKSSCHSGSR
jgi:hypothetical protein